MAQHDIYNDVTPKNTQEVTARKRPTITELRTAISGSAVSGSYPAAELDLATRNDLLFICRTHDIPVTTSLIL